ncbi:hypothetical protein Tco_0018248 [Tanacetum coccineum]
MMSGGLVADRTEDELRYEWHQPAGNKQLCSTVLTGNEELELEDILLNSRSEPNHVFQIQQHREILRKVESARTRFSNNCFASGDNFGFALNDA